MNFISPSKTAFWKGHVMSSELWWHMTHWYPCVTQVLWTSAWGTASSRGARIWLAPRHWEALYVKNWDNNWLCGCCQFMSFSCQQILCCTREEIYLTRDVQPNMFNCLASGRMAETDVTDSLELRKSKKKKYSKFKKLERFKGFCLHVMQLDGFEP